MLVITHEKWSGPSKLPKDRGGINQIFMLNKNLTGPPGQEMVIVLSDDVPM